MVKNSEIKRDRFIRIVERRVERVLYDLDTLGKCSNKKNYEYTDTDVKKIFREIQHKTKEIRSLFQGIAQGKRKFMLER